MENSEIHDNYLKAKQNDLPMVLGFCSLIPGSRSVCSFVIDEDGKIISHGVCSSVNFARSDYGFSNPLFRNMPFDDNSPHSTVTFNSEAHNKYAQRFPQGYQMLWIGQEWSMDLPWQYEYMVKFHEHLKDVIKADYYRMLANGNMPSDVRSKQDLETINFTMKEAKKHKLETETIFTAMSLLKERPNLTISDAIRMGLENWTKLG